MSLVPEIVHVGDTQRFECQVIGFPTPNVSWFKDEVDITHNPRYNIGFDPSRGVITLMIKNVKRSDEGCYQCRAENEEGYATTTAYLVVRMSRDAKFSRDYQSMVIEKVSEEETTQTQLSRSARQTVIEEVITRVEETEQEIFEEKIIPPRITYDEEFSHPVSIRAGASIYIEVDISGQPFPKVAWFHGDSELHDDARVATETMDGFSLMKVRGSTAADSGQYKVTAENTAGKDTALFDVVVKSPPSPPRNLRIKEVYKDYITIEWDPPEFDGGEPILNYQVEKSLSGGMFVSAGMTHKNEFRVNKLYEGNEYLFQVRAENKIGPGQPGYTDKPCKAKMPFDPPGKPRNLQVTEVFKDYICLAWEKPETDGGSKIIQYIVEKLDVTRASGMWVLVGTVDSEEHDFKVTKLFQGNCYLFRVYAENRVGAGEAVELTEPVTAKLPYDKPEPPRNLRAIETSSDYIVIQWEPPERDGGSPITSYIIEKRDAKRTGYIFISDVSATTFTFKATRLFEGLEYYFRVFAENIVGPSEPIETLDPIKAKLPYDEPGAPRNVRVTEYWIDHITIAWDAPETDGGSPITGYTIEKRDALRTTWIRAGSTASTKLTHECLNLIEGTDYYFRVFAENKVGVSPPGEIDKPCRAKMPFDPPFPPRNIRILDYNVDYITVAWDAPENDGGSAVTQYVLEKRDASRVTWMTVTTVESTIFKWKVSNLVEGEAYFFRVAAENQVGRGEYLETIDTQKAKLPFDKPGKPRGLRVTDVWKDYFSIVWDAPDSDGGSPITGYTIELRDALEPSFKFVVGLDAAAFTYQLTNLSEGHSYYVRVYSQNAAGLSEKPAENKEAIKAKLPYDRPDAPRNLHVTGTGNGTISVAWEAPESDGGSPITAYILEYSLTTATEYTIAGKFDPTKFDHELIGLREGGDYFIRIKAENAAGVSKAATELDGAVRAKEAVRSPNPPRNFHVSDIDRTQVTLNWDAPDFDGGMAIRSYEILSKMVGESEYATAVIVEGSARKFRVVALTEGEEYQFGIVAENKAMLSSDRTYLDSSVVPRSKFDHPSAPRNVRVIDIDKTNVTIEWDEPKNDGGAPIRNYIILMRTVEETEYSEVTVVRASTRQHKVLALKEGMQYMLAVRAENAAPLLSHDLGELDQPVTPKSKIDVPSSPRKLHVVDFDKSSVTLQWEAPKLDGGAPIKLYIIQCRLTSEEEYKDISAQPATDLSYKAIGLKEGAQYMFAVKAENAAPLLSKAAELSEPVTAKNRVEAPSSPRNLVATEILHNAVTIRWEAPKKDGGSPIEGYIVEISEDGQNYYEVKSMTADNTKAMLGGLSEEANYFFRVSAKNSAGVGKPKDLEKDGIKTTKQLFAPSAPRNLQVTKVTSSNVDIIWDASENDGGSPIKRYIIMIKEVLDIEYKKVGKASTAAFFYSITEMIEEGKEYHIQVLAENALGLSAAGAETTEPVKIPVKPKEPSPEPPKEEKKKKKKKVEEEVVEEVVEEIVEKKEKKEKKKKKEETEETVKEEEKIEEEVISVEEVAEAAEKPKKKKKPKEEPKVVDEEVIEVVEEAVAEKKKPKEEPQAVVEEEIVTDEVEKVEKKPEKPKEEEPEDEPDSGKPVAVAPEIMEKPAPVSVKVGEVIELTCRVTGDCEVIWYRDDVIMTSDDSRTTVSKDGITYSLTITQTTVEDSGKYRLCVKKGDIEIFEVVKVKVTVDKKKEKRKEQEKEKKPEEPKEEIVEPEKTAEVEKSTEPEVPVEPEKPVEAEKPTKPVKKEEPEEPAEPEKPVETEKPKGSEKPEEPKKPSKPKEEPKKEEKPKEVSSSSSESESESSSSEDEEESSSKQVVTEVVKKEEGGEEVVITKQTVTTVTEVSEGVQPEATESMEEVVTVTTTSETEQKPDEAESVTTVTKQEEVSEDGSLITQESTQTTTTTKTTKVTKKTTKTVVETTEESTEEPKVEEKVTKEVTKTVTKKSKPESSEESSSEDSSSEESSSEEETKPKEKPVAPVFDEVPDSVTAKAGETVQLKCRITAETEFEVKWYKGDKKLKSKGGRKIDKKDDTYFLEIKEASVDDAGTYTVKATNEAGTVSFDVEVTVESVGQAPKISEMPSSVKVKETETIRISVKLTGDPEPEVTWFHDGEPIRAVADDKRISIEVDGAECSYSLEITDAKLSDAGEYTITAVNAAGKVFHAIPVKVKAKKEEVVEEVIEEDKVAEVEQKPAGVAPEFISAPEPITVMEFEKLTISAKITGTPEPNITWFKEGKPLKAENVKMKKKGEDCSLTIKSCSLLDAGEYTITATNDVGSKFVMVKVTVTGAKEEEEDKDMAVVEKLADKIAEEKKKSSDDDEMLFKEYPLLGDHHDKANNWDLKEGQVVQVMDTAKDDEWLCRLKDDKEKVCYVPVELLLGKKKKEKKEKKKEKKVEKKAESSDEEEGLAEKTVTYPVYAALMDHTPDDSETDGLALKEGEEVEVLDMTSADRWLCRTPPGGPDYRQGKVPPSVLLEKKEEKLDTRSTREVFREDIIQVKDKKQESHMKRRYTLNDLWESERDYIRDMKFALDNYCPLFDGDLPEGLIEKKDFIFCTFPDIHIFHHEKFLDELMATENSAASLGNAFLKHRDDFQKYVPYYVDREPIDSLLIEEETVKFLKEYDVKIGNVGDSKWGLREYMARPVDRIDEYISLLKDYMKYAVVVEEDVTPLQDAIQMLMDLRRQAEELAARKNIIGYPGDLDALGPLLRHDDFLVWEGEPKDKGKERHLFLFEDHLLITKKKKAKSPGAFPTFQFQAEILVPDTQLTEFLPDERRFELWFPEKDILKYVFQASTVPIKVIWCDLLRRMLRKHGIEEEATASFTAKLENVSAIEGEPVRMTCKVAGWPAPKVSWYRDGKKIKPSDDFKLENEGDTWHLVMPKVSCDFSGKYSVKAKNRTGEVESECELFVDKVAEAPVFESKPESVSCIEEEDVSFVVKVSGHPSPTVTWLRDGHVITKSNIFKIKAKGNKYTLSMASVTTDLSGTYTVQAKNTMGTVECAAELLVDQKAAAPSFEKKFESRAVNENKEVRFSCVIHGYPPPKLTWFKGDQPISESDSFKFEVQGDMYTLYIPCAAKDFGGTYKVKAVNDTGEIECSADLKINLDGVAPKFLSKLDDSTLTEGAEARFECKISGTPDPKVEWYWEDKKKAKDILIEKTVRHRMTVEEDTYILTISDTVLEDAGKYKVKASNATGEATSKAKLIVQKDISAPEFVDRFSDLDIVLGEEAEFVCKISGKPAPTVAWAHNKRPISDTDRIMMSTRGDEYKLTISSVMKSDEGMYQCRASNNQGEASCSANLYVSQPIEKSEEMDLAYKPKFTKWLSDIECLMGADVTFSTKAIGEPTPEVEWYFGDELLKWTDHYFMSREGNSFSLTIHNVKIDDAGDYTCKVKNKAGQQSCTAELIIERPVERRMSRDRGLMELQPPIMPIDKPWITELKEDTFVLNWNTAIYPMGAPTAPIRYIIERRDLPSQTWYSFKSNIILTHFEVIGYDVKCDYMYRIRAENDVGISDPSNALSLYARSMDILPEKEKAKEKLPPRSPRDKPEVVDIKETTCTVTWVAAEVPSYAEQTEITYILERRCPPSKNWITVKEEITELRYVMTGYRPEKDYMFRVRAQNKYGISDPTMSCTCFAKPADEPVRRRPSIDESLPKVKPRTIWDKPDFLDLKEDSLTLSWKASSCPNYAAQLPIWYIVEQREPPSPDWVKIAQDHKETSLKIAKYSRKKDYYFRVRAANEVGTTEPSMPAMLRRKDDYELPDYDSNRSRRSMSRDSGISSRPVPAHLRVIPEFLQKLDDTQYGVESLKATVVTRLRSYPEPKISWYFQERKVTLGERYQVNLALNGELTLDIHNFGWDDCGEYRIHIKNAYGEASLTYLMDMADPPTFLEPMKDQVFHLRKDGKLECRVHGIPYPKVEFKHDWRVIADSHRIKIARESYEHWTLNIRNAIYMDEGMYECTAENIGGKVYCTANVKLTEKAGLLRDTKFNQVPIEDYFHIIDEIGRGSCGVIRRVIDKNSGTQYAAKFLRYADEMSKEELMMELEVMAELDHNNICQVVDGYEDKKRLAIVTEIVTGGDLLSRIIREDSFRESEVAYYMRQLLLAVEYMHSRNVIHLDLMPENLYFTSHSADELKVIDFGYARMYNPNRKLVAKYATPEFCAPEVASEHPVTPAADLWSVGVITYILLSGLSPMHRDSPKQTLDAVKEGKFEFDKEAFANISEDAKDLLRKLLHKDPKKRISASDALEHKFIQLAFHRGLGDRINLDRHKGYAFRRKCERGLSLVKTFANPRPLTSYLLDAPMLPLEGDDLEIEVGVPILDLPPMDGAPPPPKSPSVGSTLEIGAMGMLQVMGPPSTFSEVGSVMGSGTSSEWGREYEDEDTWYEWSSSYQSGPETHLLPTGDTGLSVRMARYQRKSGMRTPRARTRIGLRERRDLRDLDREAEEMMAEAEMSSKSSSSRSSKRGGIWELKSMADAGTTEGFPPVFKEKIKDKAYHVGDACTLKVHVIANPPPAVSWYRNDELLTEGGRVRTQRGDEGKYSLTILSTKPHDFGVYKCVARNKYGKVTCRARMLLGDHPGRCGRPHVTKISDTEVYMIWEEPETDGNSYILAYRVDWHRPGDERWTQALYSIDECALVKGLKPDATYRFRIAALNKFGLGPYSWASVEIKTKSKGATAIDIDSETKRILLRSRQATTRPSPDRTPTSSRRGSLEEAEAEEEELDLDKIADAKWGLTLDREVHLQDKIDPKKYLTFGSEVWRGRFTIVRNVQPKEGSKYVTRVAKIIPYEAGKKEESLREYEMLKGVRQEHIIRLYEAYRFDNYVVLVLEKLYGENVARSLSLKNKYNEHMVTCIIKQVLDALQFLHHRGIVHLNLQPDNVIMISRRRFDVKLIDFGRARKITSFDGEKIDRDGTAEFMAPEKVNRDKVGVAADIWGVGVMAFILLSGVSPFRGDSTEETFANVKHVRYDAHQIYHNVTKFGLKFIYQTLKRNPTARLTTEECLDHRWLMLNAPMLKMRKGAIFATDRLRLFEEDYIRARLQGSAPSADLIKQYGGTPAHADDLDDFFAPTD